MILFQSSIKIIGVLLTGSLSFLSETVDTLTDIFFVLITIYSIYLSIKPPDYQHMYGHSKIDYIGAMVQGIVLVNIYVFLIFNAIQTIFEGKLVVNNADLGFQLLIISFMVNLIFSRILIWQGKKNNSLSLQVQGLNLFQDSLRAILVIVSFVFVIFFDITFLDPFFSVILSIWIILSSIKLAFKGIKNVIDVNPINAMILEKLKVQIFSLDHVNGVRDVKVRASGNNLFLEVHLSVEDHISIVHANKIIKAIRTMSKTYFSTFNVETVVEMNPLSGESSIGEEIINLLHSIKSEFNEISDFRNLNVFRIENKYFLSVVIVVDENLSLEEAHELSRLLENQLKEQVPSISRIITHIESEAMIRKLVADHLVYTLIDPQKKREIQITLESLLKSNPEVKGYHGLEFWEALDFCTLELHVFFDGSLNISKVHNIVSNLEQQIKETLKIENLTEIIIHSEPLEGRTDGVFF